jgi:DivIVA domain-containing protein
MVASATLGGAVIGPEDLHEVRFERELRGYCPEEVDGFLDQVVFAWRTGSRPDTLVSSLPEPHFSIAVRGYKRADVDRVIKEITAGVVSTPFAVPDRRQPAAPPPDRPDVPDVHAQPAATTTADTFFAEARPTQTGDAVPKTAEDPRAETLDLAQDTEVNIPPPMLEDGDPGPPQQSRPAHRASTTDDSPVERGSGDSAEGPSSTTGAECPDPDASGRAEHPLRVAEETRLRLIAILDQAAQDLRCPTTGLTNRRDASPIATDVESADQKHPKHQLELPRQEPRKTKKHTKKKTTKKQKRSPTV